MKGIGGRMRKRGEKEREKERERKKERRESAQDIEVCEVRPRHGKSA